METSLLNHWFSGHQINAICWTLIHSLWIGLIIALLCGIVIGTTRKSAAALRYRLLCGLLVLFVCAIGITYYLEASSASAPNLIWHAPNIQAKTSADVVANPVIIPQNQTFFDSVRSFLNQNANIIVLVWLLFFVLKSLKMVSGLLYIQRIRNYKIHPITEELKHKIEAFSGQIGIRRVVRLVQSELVKVPVVVGWLKPMILLPVGIVFQLTPEQLDGILWHELAHIRRRDYLVNILQGLVETVFFFNPGLLWLSSLIRTEREACCDDMVLTRLNRKANYLEALLSFGYGEFKQGSLAMSIGSGNQLRDRLRRMISQENKRLSVAEKSALAVGLVLLSAFTTISKDNPIVKHLTIKPSNKSDKVVTKTITVSMRPLPANQRWNDSKPGLRKKDTIRVTDTAIRFKSVIFKHSDEDIGNNDINAVDDKGNKYHLIVTDYHLVSAEVNGVKIAEDKLVNFQYLIGSIGREIERKRLVSAEDIADYKANNPAAKFKNKDAVGYSKKRYIAKGQSADLVPAKIDDKQRYTDGQIADALAANMKTEAMLKRMRTDSNSYAVQEQRAHDVIADLVHAKVVPNAEAVKWFGLTDTELIVNGQKQSNELRERLASKYGIHKDYGLFYGPVQMHGTGVFIDASTGPARPERPRPKYMGAADSKSPDSANWKIQQLIRQQQLFADEQNAKRRQLIKQQQHFSTEENKKRQQLIKQQALFAADQDKKRLQLIKQQQLLRADGGRNAKFGIDLQPSITGVISDLVTANVITDKSELIKFNLTNSALIVNGKKQSDELHERLKAKYLDQPNFKLGIANEPNFGLHFNAQNGNQGLGITDGPDSP